MNNPITIMCYGDSNTWGKDPDTGKRLRFYDRWPNYLAKLLGDNYHIISEGQLGRTILFDDEDPSVPCRNGYTLLLPLLDSHRPDYLIVMLGTNDTRFFNNASADEIVSHYVHYQRAAELYHTKLTIVAPQPAANGFIDVSTGLSANKCFNQDSFIKMQKLPAKLAEFTSDHDIAFLDPTNFTVTGKDHLHWTIESHHKFAEYLAKYFRSNLI